MVVIHADGAYMAESTRRRMMATMAGAIGAAIAARPGFGQRTASPQPMPSPNAPANENVPAGLDGSNIPWAHGKQILPATWLEIKSDASKLLEMATDFKQRVDRTNLAATLSLPLVKEAHRIEKLAKKIEGRLKG